MNTPSSETHIFLVEDDQRLAGLISEYLQQQGLQVSHEPRGDRAVQRILIAQPDLVILDIMLPGLDGHGVCRAIRGDYAGPIMMLTARDEDLDQVLGLELGADDYVIKPVKPRVLLARIQALLRRYGQAAGNKNDLRFQRLRLAYHSRQAFLDGSLVELTDNELELLWLLASHPGEVLSRELILQKLRGIGYDGMDRSVDIGISRLRHKLEENPARPQGIKTVRARGYVFVAEAW